MDWSNERYVRLYTRDTDDWLALTWQAKAAFPLLLRKVDRSGFLATKRGAVGIAAQTGLPLEVCEVALPDLLRDGSVAEAEGGYLLPNYIQAQEASASPAQRSRDHRERLRDLKTKHPAPPTQRNVSEPSLAETGRNPVPSRAVPFRAVPSQAEPEKAAAAAVDAERQTPDAVPDVARTLTIAANKAIADRFGEQPTPLISSSGKSHDLAQRVLDANIPVEFAARSVARQVGTLGAPVKSMAYFFPGIAEDFLRDRERVAVAGADPVQPLENTRRRAVGRRSWDDVT